MLRKRTGRKFFVTMICYDSEAPYLSGVELIDNWRESKKALIKAVLEENGTVVVRGGNFVISRRSISGIT